MGRGWGRCLRPQGAADVSDIRRSAILQFVLFCQWYAAMRLLSNATDVDVLTGGGATVAWAAHSWVRPLQCFFVVQFHHEIS